MSNQPQKQRSATERLNDLEQAMLNLYQTVDNMARDLLTIKDAIKLLGNKTSAIVTVAGISEDAVGAAMVANNVKDLGDKVADLVKQGFLSAEAVVTANSFVVGREQDDEGKVVNPRIQFTVAALDPEVQSKVIGHGTGEVISIAEGKLKLEILESYAIQAPTAPAAEEAPAAEVAPATSEAASS